MKNRNHLTANEITNDKNDEPARPVSMLKAAGRPGKNLFKPPPFTVTLLASPFNTGTCATVPLLVFASASI